MLSATVQKFPTRQTSYWGKELRETPQVSERAGRGAIAGVLLGAGFWAVILISLGVIKL